MIKRASYITMKVRVQILEPTQPVGHLIYVCYSSSLRRRQGDHWDHEPRLSERPCFKGTGKEGQRTSDPLFWPLHTSTGACTHIDVYSHTNTEKSL